jgi:hypothetical protein
MPGEIDWIAWPHDIDRSKRASALDTVMRHREVARPYVRVLARGARINRGPRGRSAPKEFRTSRAMVLGYRFEVAAGVDEISELCFADHLVWVNAVEPASEVIRIRGRTY